MPNRNLCHTAKPLPSIDNLIKWKCKDAWFHRNVIYGFIKFANITYHCHFLINKEVVGGARRSGGRGNWSRDVMIEGRIFF